MFYKGRGQRMLARMAKDTRMFIDTGVQVIPTFVTTWSSEDHASPQCRAKMVLDSVPSQQFWCNEPLDQGTTRNRIRKRVTET